MILSWCSPRTAQVCWCLHTSQHFNTDCGLSRVNVSPTTPPPSRSDPDPTASWWRCKRFVGANIHHRIGPSSTPKWNPPARRVHSARVVAGRRGTASGVTWSRVRRAVCGDNRVPGHRLCLQHGGIQGEGTRHAAKPIVSTQGCSRKIQRKIRDSTQQTVKTVLLDAACAFASFFVCCQLILDKPTHLKSEERTLVHAVRRTIYNF